MSIRKTCRCQTIHKSRQSLDDSQEKNDLCCQNFSLSPAENTPTSNTRLHLPLSIPPPPQQNVSKQISPKPEEQFDENLVQKNSKTSSFKEQFKSTFSKSKKPSIFSNFHSTSKLVSTPLVPLYKNISDNPCLKNSEICIAKNTSKKIENKNNVLCNNFLVDRSSFDNRKNHCFKHQNCHFYVSTSQRPNFFKESSNTMKSNCSNPMYCKVQNSTFKNPNFQHLQHANNYFQTMAATSNTFPKSTASLFSNQSYSQSTSKASSKTAAITPSTTQSFDNTTPTFLRMKSPSKSRSIKNPSMLQAIL